MNGVRKGQIVKINVHLEGTSKTIPLPVEIVGHRNEKNDPHRGRYNCYSCCPALSEYLLGESGIVVFDAEEIEKAEKLSSLKAQGMCEALEIIFCLDKMKDLDDLDDIDREQMILAHLVKIWGKIESKSLKVA